MEEKKKKLKVLTTDNKIIFLNTIHFCKQTKQYCFGIDKSNGYRIMNYNPIQILLSKNTSWCKIIYSRATLSEKLDKIVFDSIST